jgi:hypothetical protein
MTTVTVDRVIVRRFFAKIVDIELVCLIGALVITAMSPTSLRAEPKAEPDRKKAAVWTSQSTNIEVQLPAGWKVTVQFDKEHFAFYSKFMPINDWRAQIDLTFSQLDTGISAIRSTMLDGDKLDDSGDRLLRKGKVVETKVGSWHTMYGAYPARSPNDRAFVRVAFTDNHNGWWNLILYEPSDTNQRRTQCSLVLAIIEATGLASQAVIRENLLRRRCPGPDSKPARQNAKGPG